MLITKTSTEPYAKQKAGGKGHNLYILDKQQLPIPKWIIIGSDSFKNFRQANGLDHKINEHLALLNDTNIDSISDLIRKDIINTPFDEDTLFEIKKARLHIGGTRIAARSSALDEDSGKYSFAGQFDSYLSIKSEEDTLDAVKKCWASAYSERGIAYRIQNKLPLSSEQIDIAVIFQLMIESVKSGVIFTCDPVKNDNTKLIINSLYGIGEGLVSGLLDSDTFILDKATAKVIESNIVAKKTKITDKDNASGTVESAIQTDDQNKPSLNETELEDLAKIAMQIEKHFRFPQDIEWSINEQGKISILQSRPITTAIKNDEGLLNVWDNSNIIESYGGLTLPLTFTFARFVYHQVYIQFCEILMIPQKEIRNMDYFLKNMLGIFYGRIYYNLLNWYKLTSILPGYKYNREFMETMMGTDKSLESEVADRIRPPVSQNKFIKTLTGIKFLYYHFVIQKKINQFLKYFQNIYDQYRRIDYSRMTADEIIIKYRELENTLLRQWKAPIINDFLCMVHFGILKKLTQKWLGNLNDSIQNDLLCGQGNMESAEPTKELIRMANAIKKSSDLKKLVIDTDASDCMEALSQSPHKEFKEKADRYIDLYGYRCMDEMKLEQKDLYQDPSFLFICLKNYLHSDNINLENIENRERDIRSKAENEVRQNLTIIKKLIYFWSLKNARKAVRNRENTRFCRTRIYGIVRTWFYNIARDFAQKSIIDKPEDIFYLELEEVFGSLEGTLTVQNLKSLIQLRKQEYIKYEKVEPASRFITRGPAYWMNDHFAHIEHTQDNKTSKNILKGTGCCPGIVKGKIKIVTSPKDNLQLNGEILVAARTDPGWIPLYPSISGLLVERGSLLSHSAIVAREMGIPTIVAIPDLIKTLKDGDMIQMDGKNGTVEIIKEY